MPNSLDQPTTFPAEDKNVALERLCGTPHNRSYVPGEIMWRSREDGCRSLPNLESSAT
jgi:hypothetical protein